MCMHICPFSPLNEQCSVLGLQLDPAWQLCLPHRDMVCLNYPLLSLSLLPPGALSEWLADHPVMINSVLPLVLHALGNPELSVSSVSTLKKICRECKYDLPPYAANIVAVSQVCRGPGRTWASGTLCTALIQYFFFLSLGCANETDPQGELKSF